jgi:tetratricopeptide (TPR) repeat protein
LVSICRHHPVVLVLEDLQWGDLPTVRFVDRALRNLAEYPFMVLAVGRSEVHDLFPELWADREVQEIRVGELGRRAGIRLVREALGESFPTQVAERLVERSAGNAFFLEELIRAHAEDEGATAPDTVLAMLQARLEAMEPEARRVLRAASIFGGVFWRGGVIALLGGDERADEVDDWLGALTARELVTPRTMTRFPGDTEYVFRHALLRDAIYAMLTREDLELGHGLAAEWLEGVGERDAILLAEHLAKGGVDERAALFFRRAAEEALEGNDLDAALGHARRAIELGAADEELGRARLVETEVHRWRGENEAATRAAREALALLAPGSPPWSRTAAELAGALGRMGDRAGLSRLADELIERTEGESASEDIAAALARVAIYHYYVGDVGPPVRIRERLESEPSAWTPRAQAWLHVLRANEALFRGDLGAYLAEVRAARGRFLEVGALRRTVTEAVNVGYALLELGAHPEAHDILHAAVLEADQLGLTDISLMARHNLGRVLARLGRIDEARRVEREAALAFGERGDVRMEGGSRVYLAAILAQGDDVALAEEEARNAVALLADVPTLMPYALARLGRILLETGRVDEALEMAERSRDAAKALGAVEEGEALVRLVHARALHAAGRSDEARDAIREARARVEERAGHIGDATLRASFLENVPENVETFAFAEELGVPAPRSPVD